MDSELAAPCPHPGAVLAGVEAQVPGGIAVRAGAELALGRLGDELLACGEDKAAVVEAWNSSGEILRGRLGF